MLSHRAWIKLFAGDATAIGRSVSVNGVPCEIVGVMPEGFAFPVNHALWTPAPFGQGAVQPASGPELNVFGRLAAGASLKEASLELERLANHVGDIGALAGDVGFLPTASFCGRLRGDYLAIVTLGFGEIIRIILLNWYEFTRGPDGLSGIPRPTFFGLPITRTPPEDGHSFHSFFGLEYSPIDRIIFLYYLALALALRHPERRAAHVAVRDQTCDIDGHPALLEGLPERVEVRGGVSVLASRLLVRGPLPATVGSALGGEGGSAFLSARRSYFDQLLRPIADFPYHLTDLQGVVEGWTGGGDRIRPRNRAEHRRRRHRDMRRPRHLRFLVAAANAHDFCHEPPPAGLLLALAGPDARRHLPADELPQSYTGGRCCPPLPPSIPFRDQHGDAAATERARDALGAGRPCSRGVAVPAVGGRHRARAGRTRARRRTRDEVLRRLPESASGASQAHQPSPADVTCGSLRYSSSAFSWYPAAPWERGKH